MTPPACFLQIYKRHPSQSERALYLFYFINYINAHCVVLSLLPYCPCGCSSHCSRCCYCGRRKSRHLTNSQSLKGRPILFFCSHMRLCSVTACFSLLAPPRSNKNFWETQAFSSAWSTRSCKFSGQFCYSCAETIHDHLLC